MTEYQRIRALQEKLYGVPAREINKGEWVWKVNDDGPLEGSPAFEDDPNAQMDHADGDRIFFRTSVWGENVFMETSPDEIVIRKPADFEENYDQYVSGEYWLELLKNEKPVGHICYYEGHDGSWVRTEWEPQCDDNHFLRGECQGVMGHSGCHWCYDQNGSYTYWKNEDDPDCLPEKIASGSCPPGHAEYVNPVEKREEYFMEFHKTTEVTDEAIIADLKNNKPPESGAGINRPVPEEMLQEIKDE